MRTRKYSISKLDLLLDAAIVLITAMFLAQLDYGGRDALVLITFYFNGLLFLYQCLFIRENVSIRRTIYIFMLFFMFLAPLQQYCTGTVLWRGNGLMIGFSDRDFLFANICILLFCALFELGYRRQRQGKTEDERSEEIVKYEIRGNNSLLVLHLICLLAVGFIIATKGMTNFSGFSALKAFRHQLRNMLMLAPVEAFLLCEYIVRNDLGGKRMNLNRIIFAAEALVVFLLFSGDLSRFLVLGGVMMVATFYLYKAKNRSIYFSIYYVGFFFIFTAIRGKGLLSTDIFRMVNFNHVDFDAYQIFLGAIKYVSQHGIAWGRNILSALLFLVPRSIFPWKLEATGEIIASSYGSWFTNISCPVPAELYFGFGFVGLVVGAFLLGLLIKKLDGMTESNSQLKMVLFCIISGMTVYVMRGALLATMAYLLGALLGFWVITKICLVRIKK